LELLAELDEVYVPAAVTSSSSRTRVETLLSSFKIAGWFATVLTGEDVKYGKTHPEIYLHACEKINVPPTFELIVEDPVSGMKGENLREQGVWESLQLIVRRCFTELVQNIW